MTGVLEAASVISRPALALSKTVEFWTINWLEPLPTKMPSYAPVIERFARVTASALLSSKAYKPVVTLPRLSTAPVALPAK